MSLAVIDIWIWTNALQKALIFSRIDTVTTAIHYHDPPRDGRLNWSARQSIKLAAQILNPQ